MDGKTLDGPPTWRSLPKSQARSVCRQYRTINGKIYGPYYFVFWRERGKLRKAYVRREYLQDALSETLLSQNVRRWLRLAFAGCTLIAKEGPWGRAAGSRIVRDVDYLMANTAECLAALDVFRGEPNQGEPE